MKRFLLALLQPSGAWIGLFWTYTAACWLIAAYVCWSAGLPDGSVAAIVRLGVTLALGIGLCAGERWAWAGAICLGGLYALTAALLGAAIGYALLSSLQALSWQPVFQGLPRALCLRLLAGCLPAMLLGAGTATALWRDREKFDVPLARPFTTLTEHGWRAALPIILVDGYLLWTWLELRF